MTEGREKLIESHFSVSSKQVVLLSISAHQSKIEHSSAESLLKKCTMLSRSQQLHGIPSDAVNVD